MDHFIHFSFYLIGSLTDSHMLYLIECFQEFDIIHLLVCLIIAGVGRIDDTAANRTL